MYDEPIAASYGVNSTIYLGYRQWGMGDVTENLLDYFPLLALPTTPEFAFWAEDNGYSERFNEYQSQWILSGPYGLTETENMQLFYNMIDDANWTGIQDMWYINQYGTMHKVLISQRTEAQRLYEYLNEVILDAYVMELVGLFQQQGSVIILPLTVDGRTTNILSNQQIGCGTSMILWLAWLELPLSWYTTIHLKNRLSRQKFPMCTEQAGTTEMMYELFFYFSLADWTILCIQGHGRSHHVA